MFGSLKSKRNDKRSTLRRVWGAPREEKALQMPVANGLLLVYHEEGRSKICKKMPQLPNTSQFNPHPSAEFAWHGYTIALPHLGARLGWTGEPTIVWIHMDTSSYGVFY